MATRATYKIDGFLCYNHWDNYPLGTANHLLQVIKKHNAVDLFSCIRGMEGLEPAGSIYDGPAEFHYVIKGGTITVYSISDDGSLIMDDRNIPVELWITKRFSDRFQARPQDLDEGETISDYTVIKTPYGRYFTASQLHKNGTKEFNDAMQMLEKGMVGNASSSFGNAFKMLNASGLPFDEIKSEYEPIALKLVEAYNHSDPAYFQQLVNECYEPLTQ